MPRGELREYLERLDDLPPIGWLFVAVAAPNTD